jgi:hypothetical protein
MHHILRMISVFNTPHPPCTISLSVCVTNHPLLTWESPFGTRGANAHLHLSLVGARLPSPTPDFPPPFSPPQRSPTVYITTFKNDITKYIVWYNNVTVVYWWKVLFYVFSSQNTILRRPYPNWYQFWNLYFYATCSLTHGSNRWLNVRKFTP